MSHEDEDLTTDELAERLSRAPDSVLRWRDRKRYPRPCPSWEEDDGIHWSLSQVRAWLAATKAAGGRVGTGAGRPGGAPAAPAGVAIEDPEFSRRLDGASTREEVAELLRYVVGQVQLGRYQGGTATALRGLIKDLAENLRERERDSRGREAVVSEEAKDLAEKLDQLVSAPRRAQVMALVDALLTEERETLDPERPDETGEQLAREGLDAWGDLIPEEAQ